MFLVIIFNYTDHIRTVATKENNIKFNKNASVELMAVPSASHRVK